MEKIRIEVKRVYNLGDYSSNSAVVEIWIDHLENNVEEKVLELLTSVEKGIGVKEEELTRTRIQKEKIKAVDMALSYDEDTKDELEDEDDVPWADDDLEHKEIAEQVVGCLENERYGSDSDPVCEDEESYGLTEAST